MTKASSRKQAVAIALSEARKHCHGQIKGSCAAKKVHKVMSEYKHGTLHSGRPKNK